MPLSKVVGFNGVLRVDGYAGYNGLADAARPGGAVTLAYCWSHFRRQFYDIAKKLVERLWREEGLQLPQRHKKRKQLYHHDASVIPAKLRVLVTRRPKYVLRRIAAVGATFARTYGRSARGAIRPGDGGADRSVRARQEAAPSAQRRHPADIRASSPRHRSRTGFSASALKPSGSIRARPGRTASSGPSMGRSGARL